MENISCNNFIEEIIMENDNEFECLIIKSNNIDDIPWTDSNYPKLISNLKIYESIMINKDNFIEILATKLNVKDFSNIKNLSVSNNIIYEDQYYLYEMLYIDNSDYKEYQTKKYFNGVASLLNTDGNLIYSDALLFKNHIPSLTDSMYLVSSTKQDIENILYYRINTKIVLWDIDDGWKEISVTGDLNNFAKQYFDDYDYSKIELPFLLYNINIWYLEDKDGENMFSKMLNKSIEKCIWFTLKDDEIRGNLTLDEVKKIINLSNKLNSFITPQELLIEKIDKYGRKIINNKYKILDYLYNKYN
jgi:hypothetical protein